MRDPSANDLIDFVTWVQPELDRDAAARMLIIDDIWWGVAQQRERTREFSRALLEFSLLTDDRRVGS